jgi:hypothetical protein
MREPIATFVLTLSVLWLSTFVGRQFAFGVAFGAAYVAGLMLFAFRRQAPNTTGRTDRA